MFLKYQQFVNADLNKNVHGYDVYKTGDIKTLKHLGKQYSNIHVVINKAVLNLICVKYSTIMKPKHQTVTALCFTLT